MRRPVIAGNWKMYKTVKETLHFIEQFKGLVGNSNHCDIVIAPPFTSLSAAVNATRCTQIGISAQDVFWESEGAYTGAISVSMLVEVGCRYTIIGHSERRQYCGETDEQVAKKVKSAQQNGLIAIICIGETLEERENNSTMIVIERQVRGAIQGQEQSALATLVLAYEPIWAIGTGRTATPEQAQEVHAAIRTILRDLADQATADAIRLLYGGSVRPDNIDGLMAQIDIDGALVGGASLQADSFARIVCFQ